MPKIATNNVNRIRALTNHIRLARAQLAFVGFTPDPNAQTRSITWPITGIIVMKIVTIQSQSEIKLELLASEIVVVFIVVSVIEQDNKRNPKEPRD